MYIITKDSDQYKSNSKFSINGNAGNDIIEGDSDNDQVYGNDGNNVLTGGPGNDQFNCGAGMDTITDFQPALIQRVRIVSNCDISEIVCPSNMAFGASAPSALKNFITILDVGLHIGRSVFDSIYNLAPLLSIITLCPGFAVH